MRPHILKTQANSLKSRREYFRVFVYIPGGAIVCCDQFDAKAFQPWIVILDLRRSKGQHHVSTSMAPLVLGRRGEGRDSIGS